ncbi:MAG: hypothetical protein IKL46_00095 [Clostridia bacterium]|nr:hypothetical protein [Clostridia bacterium]
MKKIIILLLCCGVLVSMIGCGGNTAPPPTESPPTTVSETIITETPTETAPPVTAVEPTEKEKEPLPAENKDPATELTTNATEPPTTTVTEKPQDEPKTTVTSKSTVSSAAETPKDNGCITIVETDDPPTEEIIIPPKPSADAVAQKVETYINQFRTEQGYVTATVIPRLTEYCKYRCTQLKTNFAHDTADQRAAAEALQYGEYVDWSLYGIEGEENYYTANVREAIGKGNWGGTADEIAYSIANGFRNSKGHWSYVGSSKYTYMAVGVMYDGYYWYVCVCMDSENTDLK